MRVAVDMCLAACLSGLLVGAARPFSHNVVVGTATAQGVHDTHASCYFLAWRAHHCLSYDIEVRVTFSEFGACIGRVES